MTSLVFATSGEYLACAKRATLMIRFPILINIMFYVPRSPRRAKPVNYTPTPNGAADLPDGRITDAQLHRSPARFVSRGGVFEFARFGFLFRQVQVVVSHQLYQFVETNFRFPAELATSFARVSQ
jgi:hypothetical protein